LQVVLISQVPCSAVDILIILLLCFFQIQANVSVLTAERDKLSLMYQEVTVFSLSITVLTDKSSLNRGSTVHLPVNTVTSVFSRHPGYQKLVTVLVRLVTDFFFFGYCFTPTDTEAY
jgi:hypothetical protein